MSFSALKARSQNPNSVNELSAELEKLNAKTTSRDERYWRPTTTKEGNGSAIIRFLPQVEGETTPLQFYFSHWFKGPSGSIYNERSLTSLGKEDPVSVYNKALWNTGSEKDKNQARAQSRKLNYVTNILVIRDPGNPENEGKVFLYAFGKKIHAKIEKMMNPTDEDGLGISKEPMNPFDMWNGAPFILKVRKVAGFPNYDESEFGTTGRIASDEEMEKIYSQVYPLLPEVDETHYKDYDALETKLHSVLGEKADGVLPSTEGPRSVKNSVPEDASDSDEIDDILKDFENKV